MPRGNVTRAILEHLAESGKIMFEAFFPVLSPYPRFLPSTYPRRRESRFHVNKRTVSSILWRLKKEDLVASGGYKRKMTWFITPQGRKHLKEMRYKDRHVQILPPEDHILRLLTFDIPEKERQKRDWLRAKLIACGFTMVQRSVFLGTRPLPEDLLKQCDQLGLGDYIHLVSVEKLGTLEGMVRRA